MIAKENQDKCQNALIVGGGPAGLATALMLAKRGWKNITVLEKRPSADYYEPDKSFNYLIDGRGQKLTDSLGLTSQLSQISVPNTEFYLTRIKPNGSRKTFQVPMVNPNRKTAYWLPRKEFVLLLYQEIQKNWQEHISIIFNAECVRIVRKKNQSEEDNLEIVVQVEGDSIQFEPSLLVGCDGINSIVRNILKEWDKSGTDKFEMKHFPSPSSGLRYKVLTLPPKFPLDNDGKERAVSNMAYSIRSVFKDRKRAVSLGLLPLKNLDSSRTANIITRPNHHIWTLKNSEEIYEFLEKAFPQLPIHQIVSLSESERFAKSEGGYFPTPQYCSGLHFASRNNFSTGVLLLGDAIHCFPPDIGQGVNSALEDVYVLNEALEKSNDNLSLALPLYESLRLPDVKALVHLAQIGYPWQYNQAPLRGKLWSINFFTRIILSRLLPFLFNPPAFFLIQNHLLSYQKIWVMAQRTTRILYILGLMIICGLFALVFRIAEV